MTQIHMGGASADLLRPFVIPTDRALLVGLSGGIGSGKSSVATAFASLGAVVADADAIAREVVEPGSVGLRRIEEVFGDAILNDDGTLNRGALAQQVFTDARARKTLEAITHPLIAERSRQILSTAQPGNIALYDVPLLTEQHMHNQFDAVIMVDVPLDMRLSRLQARGMTIDEARKRIASQAKSDERRAICHIWITNTGSLVDLQRLVATVHAQWLTNSGTTGSSTGR